MDFLLQNIIPYVVAYKYTALFAIAFIAAFIVPIPSGSVLMAVSAFVLDGYFNLGLIIIISIIGNLLGDSLGYWVARLYGEKIFSHLGFKRLLKSKTFNLIEERFREHPGFIVLASRFEVFSTLSVNLLSGLGKVPYRKYLLYESIGTIGQVCLYSSIGYIFRYNWQAVNTLMGKISLIIGLILILLIISFWSKIIEYLKRGIKA